MKLATFSTTDDARPRLGLVTERGLIDLSRVDGAPDTMAAYLTDQAAARDRIAAAAVDVPEEHIESRMARARLQKGLASDLIRIGRSEKRPPNASVATRLHGWWYYIDQTDADSKLYFRTLSAIWAAQMATADRGAAAPLLTVPVTR